VKRPLRYVLRVAWDARPRDLERDASQLHRLLRRLGEIDGRLAHWFAADGAGAGQTPLPIDSPKAIVSRLEADRREWDHDSRHYTGCQATFGNGLPGGGACTVQVAFGIDVPSTTIWFPNSFSLQLWGPGRADTFHDAALVKRALVAAAETFQARWGMAGPRRFPKSDVDDEMAGRPLVSWLLYLSARYGTPPPLPLPSSVELCAGGGHLIAVVSEWLDPADGDHVAARDRVHETLGHAGLLPPTAVDVVE
jgi:hypothetical protein